MQQEKEILDDRMGAESGKGLEASQAKRYERRYGELARRLTVDAVLTFEPDF